MRAHGRRTHSKEIEVGQEVDDFDLLMGLGRGAFARVFLARQRSMQRLIALKVSHNHGSEPQTLAQLTHDNIVRVFDERLIANRELKLMYMEYVPGGTLLGVLERAIATPPNERSGRLLIDSVDDALRNKGFVRPHGSGVRERIAGMSWPETVAWLGRRIAGALDYAARHGVLHRDIKPANVLLTAEGVPKLADFNISFSDHIAGASPVAYFGGSLPYMSPEQLRACHSRLPGVAADLDGRSDIYALGIMLWELLTGHRPFDDETNAGESEASLERMLALRLGGIDKQSLSNLPADCPATLRRVLLTCLAPRQTDRWRSGAEVAQQLELCLDVHARNLVDPPLGSLRARLRLRPVPVASLAVLVGQALGLLYLLSHNGALVDAALQPTAQDRLDRAVVVVALTFHPVCVLAMVYACRTVIVVPWNRLRGKRYDPATLARARSDTLLCGERMAFIVLTGWIAALVVLGSALVAVGELSAGLLANIFASHLISGLVATVFPYFVVAFHVVRWYYPALLTYGTTTVTDAERLPRIGAAILVYLVVAASVPPAGVAAGIMFLDPAQLQLVIGSIMSLCVGGVFAIIGAYWLCGRLKRDLAARWSESSQPKMRRGSVVRIAIRFDRKIAQILLQRDDTTMQRLNTRQADAVRVDGIDPPVRGAQSECSGEVLSHRTQVADAVVVEAVGPHAQRQYADWFEYFVVSTGTPIGLVIPRRRVSAECAVGIGMPRATATWARRRPLPASIHRRGASGSRAMTGSPFAWSSACLARAVVSMVSGHLSVDCGVQSARVTTSCLIVASLMKSWKKLEIPQTSHMMFSLFDRFENPLV